MLVPLGGWKYIPVPEKSNFDSANPGWEREGAACLPLQRLSQRATA